jgi:hypothetical protein
MAVIYVLMDSCGALGVGVILILYKPQHQNKVISFLKSIHLNIISYGHDIAEGFKIGGNECVCK